MCTNWRRHRLGASYCINQSKHQRLPFPATSRVISTSWTRRLHGSQLRSHRPMIRQMVEPRSNSTINIVLENKLWPEILVISTNKTPFIECIIHHKPNEKQLHLINGHTCNPFSINGFTNDSSHFEAQHASTPSRRGKQRDQRGAPGRNARTRVWTWSHWHSHGPLGQKQIWGMRWSIMKTYGIPYWSLLTPNWSDWTYRTTPYASLIHLICPSKCPWHSKVLRIQVNNKYRGKATCILVVDEAAPIVNTNAD